MSKVVLIPVGWAAEIIDSHMQPHDFIEFVMDKCEKWEGEEIFEEYLTDWAMAACVAGNKSNLTKTSQMGTPLLDIDVSNEAFGDWSDARITQTLGPRAGKNSGGGGGGDGATGLVGVAHTPSVIQPIVNVTMAQPHRATTSEIDMAFHHGADAQKRRTETATPSGTSYTPKQLVHLMGSL